LNILFITWDGPQTSYLEGLFLPIFQVLKTAGFNVHVLQFTWDDAQVFEHRRIACEEAGCSYERVSVIRKPIALGSLMSAFLGYKHIRKAISKWNIDVVMPRSTLPALSSLMALYGRKTSMLFDADGLQLDERVDFSGLSPSGPVYRLLRDIEAQAVRRAGVVITRSDKAVEILLARAGAGTNKDKFHVVANGRDTDLFNPGDQDSRTNTRELLGVLSDTPLLVYAGSIGPQYCVPEMLRLFELVKKKRPKARFLILTGSPDIIKAQIKSKANIAGSIIVKTVTVHEVPAYLACADLGIAFRKSSFSMQGVAPIKLGEYLLCGLPLVATEGIGDTHMIDKKVGALVKEINEAELEAIADWFVDEVVPLRKEMRESCSRVGVKYFSLKACSNSYIKALTQVTQGRHD
tara:strand:+ start:26097 stop:27314 length:1218 start_codon:yes stop_codon:yes gene_type:complete